MTLSTPYSIILVSTVNLLLECVKTVQTNLGHQEKVCCPQTGCLSMGAPWSTKLRPFPPPRCPDQINVGYYLDTRNTIKRPLSSLKVDTSNPMRTLRSLIYYGNYCSYRRRTVFIIHGFASGVNATWIRNMSMAYLTKVDANVFMVDWAGGARQDNYLQVASNTRVVGIILAKFIQFLLDATTLRTNKIHIIGHSLGSHIAGYVGKMIPNIDRITALDAAQPGFEGSDARVRLDRNDARNIDAHHTDAELTFPLFGFGFIGRLGNVDFYYNGGKSQPGCVRGSLDRQNITSVLNVMKFSVNVIGRWLSCSHSRAYEYFTEALRRNDCVMWGAEADFYKTTLNLLTYGKIQSLPWSGINCTSTNCSPVGLDTFAHPARGDFYVTTAASLPYCSTELMKKLRFNGHDQFPSREAPLMNVQPRSIGRTVKRQLKIMKNIAKIVILSLRGFF